MSAVHREQVPDRDCFKILPLLRGKRIHVRKLVREEIHEAVGQLQQTFIGGKADRGGRECLAHGVKDVRLSRGLVSEPFLFQDLPVLDNHDAVHVHGVGFDGPQIL